MALRNPTPTAISFSRSKATHAHSRLMKTLLANGFFNTEVGIQYRAETDENRTPTGDFDRPAIWTDLHVSIPARVSVPQSAERQANERTTEWGRYDADMRVIALGGDYSDIKPDMRLVTSIGEFIDIRGVITDSEAKMTTITGRIMTPGSEGFE